MKADVTLPAPAVPKPLDIPLSLHTEAASKLVAKHGGKDADNDDIIGAMANGAHDLAELAARIKTTADKILADVLTPELNRYANARKRAKQFSEAAVTKLNSTRERIAKAINALEADTLPKPSKDMLGVTVEMRQIEVRQALRNMQPDQRLKVLHDAVEQHDALFASAVINASTTLSGIGQAEQLLVRDYWQRTHHADTLARLRRLRAAQSELDRLGTLFEKWSGAILLDKAAAVAAGERSHELARAAMKDTSACEPNWQPREGEPA